MSPKYCKGGKRVRVREENVTKRSEDWGDARKGPQAEEYKQLLEAGKMHLNFSPMGLISAF